MESTYRRSFSGSGERGLSRCSRRQRLYLVPDMQDPGVKFYTHLSDPIGSPGKLPPRRLATGLGHAREPEINAIGQNRSEQSLPIFGRHLGAPMQESIARYGRLGGLRRTKRISVFPGGQEACRYHPSGTPNAPGCGYNPATSNPFGANQVRVLLIWSKLVTLYFWSRSW